MMNMGRKLGVNIFILMKNKNITPEVFAEKLNYSYRDVHRILEGKIMLSPIEVKKIAGVFGKTKKELLHYEVDDLVLELQYKKEFSNTDNLEKILDLLDEYVELKECI